MSHFLMIAFINKKVGVLIAFRYFCIKTGQAVTGKKPQKTASAVLAWPEHKFGLGICSELLAFGGPSGWGPPLHTRDHFSGYGQNFFIRATGRLGPLR